jgi:hypothetical protein
MKRFAMVCASLVMMPLTASAVCIIEPLEPKLQLAETVYVGTVVKSALIPSLDELRNTENPHQRRRLAVVRHTVQPEIVFKGDPSTVGAVLSTWQYNDPKARIRTDFAELTTLMPGDTILVVAEASGPAQYGLCTASRVWGPETEKVVRKQFPSAP